MWIQVIPPSTWSGCRVRRRHSVSSMKVVKCWNKLLNPEETALFVSISLIAHRISTNLPLRLLPIPHFPPTPFPFFSFLFTLLSSEAVALCGASYMRLNSFNKNTSVKWSSGEKFIYCNFISNCTDKVHPHVRSQSTWKTKCQVLCHLEG